MQSSKLPASKGRKLLNLAMFAVVCLLLGYGTLFLIFNPSVNPGLFEEAVFEPKPLELGRTRGIGGDRFGEQKLDAASNHDFSDEDFAKCKLTKPQEVSFKTLDNETLRGWYFDIAGAKSTVLLNGSGYGDRRYAASLGYLNMLKQDGLSVFIYDYRGFNGSTGKSKLTTALKDGQAAYDYLVNEVHKDPGSLVLMGREIGAYVACHIETKQPPQALVLEEPWSNLRSFVVTRRPLMSIVPRSLYPGDAMDNVKAARDAKCPVLVVATGDSVGPYSLLEVIRQPKRLIEFEQANPVFLSVTGRTNKRYAQKLDDFLSGRPEKKETIVYGPATPIKWSHDPDAAFAQAKKENKRVLIDFYTDWCGWCKVLDEQTYPDPKVQGFVNKNFVALKLNAEDGKLGQELAGRYQISSYPSIVLVETNGEKIKELAGFRPPRQFVSGLNSALEE